MHIILVFLAIKKFFFFHMIIKSSISIVIGGFFFLLYIFIWRNLFIYRKNTLPVPYELDFSQIFVLNLLKEGTINTVLNMQVLLLENYP